MSTTRPVAYALAIVSIAGALLLSVLRQVDSAARVPAMLTAFGGCACLGYVGYLALAAGVWRHAARLTRSWLLGGIGIAVVGLLLQLVWSAPLFTGGGRARADDLTVLTANLQFGSADAETVVREGRRQHADVVVLEEVTFAELPRLLRAGLRRSFPHVAGLPDVSAAGTMVFSRYRLRAARTLGISNGGLTVRVLAPRPFELLAVHPSQPRIAPRSWHRDLDIVRDAATAAVRGGPTLVVGDFNATRSHPAFRSILDVGLADAAEQAGSGWQPTWPDALPKSGPGSGDHGTWLRPLIAIDHVLVSRQFDAVRTRTLPLPGSDHRALVARLGTRGLSG